MDPRTAAPAIRRFAARTPLLAPKDLTVPAEGSSTVRDLLSRYLGGILRDFLLLPAPRFGTRAAELERVQALVATLAEREPGAIASLLRRPTFSVLVRCATAELASGAPAVELAARAEELVQTALAELAFASVLPAPVAVARPVRSLVSLSCDVAARFDPPARSARFANGRIEVEADGGAIAIEPHGAAGACSGVSVTHPFPRAFANASLALVDANPLAMFEAHPDKSGNAIDLGGRSADEWLATLRSAFELVERYLPAIAAEMRLLLQQIVPVGFYEERHLSASYAESIGTVYLSLHPNLLTMTEALVHEFQHNKLNALLYLDPVIENLETELYASPVRPDPRPLRGVLLAVHAFQPIARMYEAMLDAGDPLATPDARRRFEAVVAVNREGCDVLLPNARPTAIGLGLLSEVAEIHRHFGAALGEAPGARLPPP